MPWCGCGTPRKRSASTAVSESNGPQLWRRFTPIIDNYRKFVRRTIIFNGWNWSVSQAIVPLPWIIQAPRLFAGKIDFGDVGQTATAFGNIHDSLSFFRNNYDAFAAFRAAIIRLHGLVDANAQGRALPAVLVKPSQDGAVELAGIEVRTPAGDQLIDPLDVRARHRRLAGDHRAFGRRQDHAAAQSGRIVAVRVRNAVPPGRRQRDDVLVAVAICAAGQSARRGVLPEFAGRHLRRRPARRADQGGAGPADRPAGRRTGLGQGALPG